MVHTNALTVAAAALLAALPAQAGLYSKSSPVIQLDGKSYDRLIAQSNYTSIVEFYAPWCGHCKNLQPAYEKAAKSLAGLAKVAAVDCDEDANKSFCGTMGVKGFPTLKIVKPGKKPGRPIVEDYQGARTAKGIVEAVTDKIPNLVKRLEDKTLESWLAAANDSAKAILFTDKGKTSALLKAIAIDFKGGIEIAQIRDKEKATVELFGITKFPTLLLLPGGKEAPGIVYDGELKKDQIVKFLSQASPPNPDPPAAKSKAKPKSKDTKKEPKKSSASQDTKEAKSKDKGATSESAADSEPTPASESEADSEEKNEKDKPIVEPAPMISLLNLKAELIRECLGPKTGTCILALLPPNPEPAIMKTVQALSEISHRHWKIGRKTFPFYAVAPGNPGAKKIIEALALSEHFDVIALNGKRGWWRQIARAGDKIEESDISEEIIENWVENIKLGEGAKKRIPEGLIEDEPVEAVENNEEPIVPPSEEAPKPVKVEEPVADSKSGKDSHDEL